MQLEDVKVGQKVKIKTGNLFYQFNVNKTGTVSRIDEEYVHVELDDGDDDYGFAKGLELIEDIAKPHVAPTSVKEAITKVEAALAELKALVG
ncbi:hypothetical protein CNR37_00117 [Pseudomonas phage ventosus]|uniref:Uncharacterized protein n=1 Tax=Pseudomonas phage ventosus TaxID=2048980 RepID=A0A2H4P810_9CAUD|nr:hypothetical protein CNR37_00117 [Pseudomonas phage ventosus]